MNFTKQNYPALSNKEYRNLIQITKKKDPELFNTIVSYIDEKISTFLDNFTHYEKEHNSWLALSTDMKVQTILICIKMDLSFFRLSEKEIEEIIPNLLKIFAETLRRKFTEEDKTEIIVEPEYQELLDEAFRIIDSEEEK